MAVKLVRNAKPVQFNDPAAPEHDIPNMPWDITSIDNDDLAELFSQFTAWANFLAVASTDAELVEDDLFEAKGVVEARHMLTGSNATKARAERDVAEDVQAARKAHRGAKRNRKRIEALRDNCVRSANACSRDLTRRLAIMQAERRSDRLHP